MSTSLALPRAPMPAHRASRRPLPRVRNWVFTGVVAAATLISAQAFAAGSSMPWEEPLQKILESIEAPSPRLSPSSSSS